jgi:hypothetical protein
MATKEEREALKAAGQDALKRDADTPDMGHPAYQNELLAQHAGGDDAVKASIQANSPVGSNAAYRDGKDTK